MVPAETATASSPEGGAFLIPTLVHLVSFINPPLTDRVSLLRVINASSSTALSIPSSAFAFFTYPVNTHACQMTDVGWGISYLNSVIIMHFDLHKGDGAGWPILKSISLTQYYLCALVELVLVETKVSF